MEVEKDAIINNYCNGIKLTNSEVLSELEILKNFKGNEVMVDSSINSQVAREYVALAEACKLVKFEIDKESSKITDYDQAIETLDTFISQNVHNPNIESFEIALKALIQLRDLNIKIKNNKMIYYEGD